MKFDIKGWIDTNLQRVHRSGTSGVQFKAVCPFCQRTDIFSINTEKGHWQCFSKGCARRGRGLGGFCELLAEVEGIPVETARTRVFREVANFPRQDTPETLLQRIAALRGQTVEEAPAAVDAALPEEFIPVFNEDTQQWSMPLYLKNRGITRQMAHTWGIGYCRKGRYANRIVLPIVCPTGRSFTTRATMPDQQPRYLNPLEVDNRTLLYGWPHVNPTGDIVLVEGPFDVLRAHSFGIPAVGITGNRITDPQLTLLLTRPASSSVTVMLDPQELTAPAILAAQLMVRFRDVFIARLDGPGPLGADGKPEKLDPGNATKPQFMDALRRAQRFTGSRGPRLEGVLAELAIERRRIFQ